MPAVAGAETPSGFPIWVTEDQLLEPSAFSGTLGGRRVGSKADRTSTSTQMWYVSVIGDE